LFQTLFSSLQGHCQSKLSIRRWACTFSLVSSPN